MVTCAEIDVLPQPLGAGFCSEIFITCTCSYFFCKAVRPLLVVNRADGQSTWPAVTGVWASLQWTGALSFLRCLGVGLGVGASPLAYMYVGWAVNATEE